MSDMSEVKTLLEAQQKAFEDFKVIHTKQLEEIKKSGAPREDTEAKLAKVNADLDNIGRMLAEVKAAQQRPLIYKDANGAEITEEQMAHKKAFQGYMRRGNEDGLRDLERKTLSVGSDPDGGYWVTPDTTGKVISKVYQTSAIRQYASQQTISTDALEGVIDNGEASQGWVGEQTARPATGTPQVGKWRIPVFEQYAMPEATQSLLDDAAVDVEGWLAAKIADKFARSENTAFLTGDGVTRPRGILSYTTAATADSGRAWGTLEHVATGTSGGFGTAPNGSNKLIDLVHAMKQEYRGGAAWFMNSKTLGAVRQLQSNSQYIWLPSMDASVPSSLLGLPVVEFPDMADMGANSYSIMLANLSLGYQIVDRQGIRVLRDPFTNKPFVRFYTTKRVGGDVLHFEAIKFLKFI